MRQSVCLFCSLGCGFAMDEQGRLEFAPKAPVNKGALCTRGNLIEELLVQKGRIPHPMMRGRRGLHECTWDEALLRIKHRLRKSARIGVLIGALNTNEEMELGERLAYALGARVWSTHDVLISTASRYNDILGSDCVLLFGGVFELSPIIARYVLAAKYHQKGENIIALEPLRTGTTWFATSTLLYKQGAEPLLLAGLIKACCELRPELAGSRDIRSIRDLGISLKDIGKITGVGEELIRLAAQAFVRARKASVLYALRDKSPTTAQLAQSLSNIREGVFLSFYPSGNAFGARNCLHSPPSLADMLEEINEGSIDTLFVFNDDVFRIRSPLASSALKKLNLLVVSSAFENKTSEHADVLLPSATWLEKSGTVTSSENRNQKLNKIVEPIGEARSEAEIVQLIARALNLKLERMPVSARRRYAKVRKAEFEALLRRRTWSA